MEPMQYGYFGHIAKYEKTEDGTLMVYGKAAGPDLDLDEQICDPAWLKTAMPSWHAWGNVREQHANIAAGVGVELTQDGDDWYLKAEIVDPGTIRKVEKRVLKGFSVGIVNGRVIKDSKARGGRINDGTIAEISLVDRPANPTATLAIAKSAGALNATLEPVAVPQGSDVIDTLVILDDPAGTLTPEQDAALIEKSVQWYRDALRTVEDALAYRYALPVDDAGRVIAKAAGEEAEGGEDEHADIAGAYAAIDKIADLIISEAQGLKGGNLREIRDIETLIGAVRSLCCFIECERDEDEPGIDDDDVHGYGLGDDKAYMAKAFGLWDGLDAKIDPRIEIDGKSVSAATRRQAKREGDTMPDGSYPITNQDQLDSAVHLAGHSKTYSRARVLAHIRRQARKHGLTLPDSLAGGSTAGDKAAGDATVADVQAEITKAVAAAQAESAAAHEAEIATLRAKLEKALDAPAPGGPVTFKTVHKTSSAPRSQATEDNPAYWRTLATQPNLDESIRRAYIAKAASLTQGAST